ncbi:hypothetical protein GCM10023317_59840 [Actinopolymorpha pittospori]
MSGWLFNNTRNNVDPDRTGQITNTGERTNRASAATLRRTTCRAAGHRAGRRATLRARRTP